MVEVAGRIDGPVRPRRRWRGCCTGRGVAAPIIGASKMSHLEDAGCRGGYSLVAGGYSIIGGTIYRPHPILSFLSQRFAYSDSGLAIFVS